ncbi:MAG TPA: DUF421 domain-containing protein [Bacillota bacterium]|nr:DUF421 domain-containing protein [Bacillota bacterium]
MSNLLPMLYETIFGFVTLFALTKVLGKTQISQLTAFDFIAALVLGELVGNALFDEKAGVLEIGYIILLWGILLYTVEMLTQKFSRTRYFLEGKPAMIIHKGKIIYEEMRKNKIDVSELQHLLRMKDVFSIQEVEYAILESNGDLSVMKKGPFQTPNKKDLNVLPEEPEIATTLISDGVIYDDNLAEIDQDELWLMEEIKKQGYSSLKEVFYAEYLSNKKLFVLPYTKIKQKDYERKLNL